MVERDWIVPRHIAGDVIPRIGETVKFHLYTTAAGNTPANVLKKLYAEDGRPHLEHCLKIYAHSGVSLQPLRLHVLLKRGHAQWWQVAEVKALDPSRFLRNYDADRRAEVIAACLKDLAA